MPNEQCKNGKREIGAYRCIQLEEWQDGGEIHRNWTYVNTMPSAGDSSVGLGKDNQPPLKKNRNRSPDRMRKCRSRNGSPLGRRLKQQRILDQEMREMMSEERQRQQVADTTVEMKRQNFAAAEQPDTSEPLLYDSSSRRSHRHIGVQDGKMANRRR